MLIVISIALLIALIALAAIQGAKKRRERVGIEPAFHGKQPGFGFFIFVAIIFIAIFYFIRTASP